MINAPIDPTMKHLIIYVCFLSQDKKGSIVIMFIELLKVETMHSTNMGLFLEVWMEYIEINNSRNKQYYINDWQSPRIVNKVKE